MSASPPKVPKPPPGAQRWIRYLVGFGVSVAIGLAPFLGTVNVPLFTPLLSLFPKLPWDTTRALIPLSSILMGMLAVVIQFLGRDKVSRSGIRRWFYRSTGLAVAGLLLLLVLHPFIVVSYSIPVQNAEISVLVGFSRPSSCKECKPGESDIECLEHTTLDPTRIRTCWGDRQLQLAYLALALPYLILMSAFGLMVGLLMLLEGSSPRSKKARV